MKKLITISAIVMSGLVYNTANAQIRIGIRLPHIVIVPRPVVVVRSEAPVYQEPVVSDDCDFYYLPDVGAYYSVAEQCYYYQDGNNWVSAAYLPGVYHDFDWRYAARKFEVHESRPYLHNDIYRGRYQGFDRDLARNHDHFVGGFDFRHDRDAYNRDHFDNRGGFARYNDHRDGNNNPHFGRGDNNHNYGNDYQHKGQANNRSNRNNDRGQQGGQNHDGRNSQNHDRSNNGNQQRLAQNSSTYGHGDGKRDRF